MESGRSDDACRASDLGNPTDKDLTISHTEVMPTTWGVKAEQVEFTPRASKVIEPDPIVSWTGLRIPKKTNVSVSYRVPIAPPVEMTNARGALDQWRADQISRQSSWNDADATMRSSDAVPPKISDGRKATTTAKTQVDAAAQAFNDAKTAFDGAQGDSAMRTESVKDAGIQANAAAAAMKPAQPQSPMPRPRPPAWRRVRSTAASSRRRTRHSKR